MSENRVRLLGFEEMRQQFINLVSKPVFDSRTDFYGELLSLAGMEVGYMELVLSTTLAFSHSAPSPFSLRDHYRAMIGGNNPVLEEAIESMVRITAGIVNRKRKPN